MRSIIKKERWRSIVRTTGVAFLLSMVAGACDLHAQDGSYRADQGNTGYYSSSNGNFTSLKWRYTTKGRIYSTPIVSGEQVFFGSNDSSIYALDAATGGLNWKFETGGMMTSSPAIHQSVVYALSMDANLYALNASTGEELWHFTTGGEQEREELGLYGTLPLDENVADPWDFYLSSPLVVDTLVFFGSSDSNIYAVNIKTGLMLWSTTTGQAVHSTPAFSDGKLFCSSWDSKVYALDPLTGAINWSFQTEIPADPLYLGLQGSPAVSGGLVFISTRNRTIYSLDADEGTEVWKLNVGNTWVPGSLAVDENRVYSGSSFGFTLYSLDKMTGSIIYGKNLNNLPFASPAITDEWIYEGTFGGRLYGFEKETGQIRWEFQHALSIANHLNLSRVDGSLDQNPLIPLFDYAYTEAQRQFLNELFKTGSIVSSPVTYDGVIYFSATDSSVYALETVDIQIGDTDLGMVEKGTIAEHDFEVTITGTEYDSATLSVKSNSASEREAFTFQPDLFQPESGVAQAIHMEVATGALTGSKKNIPIYIDYWQSGNRNRAIAYVTAELTAPEEPEVLSGNESNESVIRVYPNPFSDEFSIVYTLETPGFVRISLLSAAGTEVMKLDEGHKSAGTFEVKGRATLATGMYLLKVITEKGQLFQRVIQVE